MAKKATNKKVVRKPSSKKAAAGANKVSVLVTGDIVIDHHIYEGNRHHFGDVSSDGVRTIDQLGGAGILAEVVDLLSRKPDKGEGEVSDKDAPPETEWLTIPDNNALTNFIDQREKACETRYNKTIQEAYAFWRPYPQGKSREKQFWRVAEAMGFGKPESPKDKDSCLVWSDITPFEGLAPNIIAISEGGMGFRNAQGCWDGLDFKKAKHIVLKTAAPIADGELWTHLKENNHLEKLTLIISASDIRESTARISSGLSWDTTLEDTLREFRKGGALEELAKCQHLIISYGTEGALWFDTKEKKIHFVFEPGSIENEQRISSEINNEGTVFGLLTALTASVVSALTARIAQPNAPVPCCEALSSGLSAMQSLWKEGHGPANENAKGFPAKFVAESIRKPETEFTRTEFYLDGKFSLSGSSILKRVVCGEGPTAPAYKTGRLTALYGKSALRSLPHLEIGGLFTADRDEVESLRVLTQVIRRYQEHDEGKKPLSIGVFGPPGAGKSFAVKQLAKKLFGDKVKWLEFNLSQFADSGELNGAFHQIRDAVLKGKTPVAFFDEFDSRKFHWLQYLLAPMQDGLFQEKQLTHTLGKAIFIFAGGTSWTFETFGPPEDIGKGKSEKEKEKNEDARTEFRLAKGPDFKSRLDAYFNVMGPNQRFLSPPPQGTPKDKIKTISGHEFGRDENDICYPLRRALMMRSMLSCNPGKVLKVDEGLLYAILKGPDYRHGARSLGNILEVLKTSGKGKLQRSFLPQASQLAMHTDDVDVFTAKLETAPPDCGGDSGKSLSNREIDILAPAIHDAWREIGKSEDWLEPADDIPLDELREKDPFKAKSNEAAATRMHCILEQIGLSLVVKRKTKMRVLSLPARKLLSEVKTIIECHLELLAFLEHEGWMEYHRRDGWKKGPKKDGEKMHPCLIPYPDLSNEEKRKDRVSIRLYPKFADMAKRRIVRMKVGVPKKATSRNVAKKSITKKRTAKKKKT